MSEGGRGENSFAIPGDWLYTSAMSSESTIASGGKALRWYQGLDRYCWLVMVVAGMSRPFTTATAGAARGLDGFTVARRSGEGAGVTVGAVAADG